MLFPVPRLCSRTRKIICKINSAECVAVRARMTKYSHPVPPSGVERFEEKKKKK